MGYTTEFTGQFNFNKALTIEQFNYLKTFSETRRMKRNPLFLQDLYGGEHGLNGKYGIEGEFFCKDDNQAGQGYDSSIIDYNKPSITQPGLWCGWEPSKDGKSLVWNEVEKFYNYVEWLQYMIPNFFLPWNIVLNGSVQWQGEDEEDKGTITIVDNQIRIYEK